MGTPPGRVAAHDPVNAVFRTARHTLIGAELAPPTVPGTYGMMTPWSCDPDWPVEDSFLDEFATRHRIRRIALFGSALREDFGRSSDIDLLVEFLPGHTPGLLHLAHIELELETVVGRRIELRTYENLSPYFRDDVAATARPLHAA